MSVKQQVAPTGIVEVVDMERLDLLDGRQCTVEDRPAAQSGDGKVGGRGGAMERAVGRSHGAGLAKRNGSSE